MEILLCHDIALFVFAGTTDTPETKTNEEAVRSLLVITGSPPINPNYEAFKRKVNEYDNLPPFSFPDPFNTLRQVGSTSQLCELSDNQRRSQNVEKVKPIKGRLLDQAKILFNSVPLHMGTSL